MNIESAYSLPPLRYQQTVREFARFDDFINPVAVTLTLKQRVPIDGVFVPIDEVSARGNMRHFLNRLNVAVFGNASKRFNKRIPCIPVTECDETHRMHHHLLLDRPERLDDAHFELTIWLSWKKTLWAASEIAYEPSVDAGWLDYMTKLRTKRSFTDSIDWENWVPPTRRLLT